MLKTVTLEDEEIEILLSYHKQKLADVAKEIQTLTEKQQFSEARLHDLTEVHEKEDEASIEEHLSDVVEIQDDGTLTVAAAHEEVQEHVEETPIAETEHEVEAHEEETPVAEASHEPEAVIEQEEIPAAEAEQEVETPEEETPVAEVEHEHEEETPVAEAEHKAEELPVQNNEIPVAEISHEPEAVPHKGTFTIASEQ